MRRTAACIAIALLFGCGESARRPATHALTIFLDGDGSGHVLSPAFDCNGQCMHDVAANTTIQLTAAPSPGSKFVGWRGACSGTGACAVTLDLDREVTASFSSPCAPIAEPTMHQYVRSQVRYFSGCGFAVGDASGVLAFPSHYEDPALLADALDFVTTDFRILIGWGMHPGVGLQQQPAGTSSVSGAPGTGPLANRGSVLQNFDSAGRSRGQAFIFGTGLTTASDPNGGVLFAGDLATSSYDAAHRTAAPSGPIAHSAVMFVGGDSAPEIRWGPKALASAGTVYGGGVDNAGRSLIITDGTARFGDGSISAQWFDRNGEPLTGEFVLLSRFEPGLATWFETSPLIGSGLMVRRMDGIAHALALVTVASGAASVQPAPAWMVARADARLQIAHGGRNYAVLPYAATKVPCIQRLEVLAPDGTSCGTRDYPIADGTCDTHDLMLGADGTVIQQLPDSMESWNPDLGARTCTWRWWTRAVK